MLPIIGAGIVLLTFVVKDTWRDHARGIADEIEQAERNHLAREDNEAFMSELKNIYQRVRYPNNQERDVDLIASDNSYQSYLVVLRLQQQAARSLKLISDFMDHLSQQEANKKAAADLKKTLDTLGDDLEKIENAMTGTDFANAGAPHDIPEASLSDFQRVRHQTSLLSSSVRNLDQTVLQQARAIKENTEFWYVIWSAISVVLFAAGWGLGLVGQIYGLRTGSGGD
jgi:hypothetical protein